MNYSNVGSFSSIIEDGVYQLTNAHSSKVLEVPNYENAPGYQLQQREPVPNQYQQWAFERLGSGYYKITSYGIRLVLEVAKNNHCNGSPIQTGEWRENNHYQQWSVFCDSAGVYTLANRGSGKVVGIAGGSNQSGAVAEQCTSEGQQWQKWQIAQAIRNDYHWLYFGWPDDPEKSWSWKSGTLAPGAKRVGVEIDESKIVYRTPPIYYHLEFDGVTHVPNEFDADSIEWQLDDYYPSPISSYTVANDTHVKIQHVANRILSDRATGVYTRVSVCNSDKFSKSYRLHVSADGSVEVPLTMSGIRVTSSDSGARYEFDVAGGEEMQLDFVTLADGDVAADELVSAGTFDFNYVQMTQFWDGKLDALSRPTRLPDDKLISLYKHNLIILWQSIVKTEDEAHELRASGGTPLYGIPSYSWVFSHDIPNMVVSLLQAGDFKTAKQVIESTQYQNLISRDSIDRDYLDAVPKFIIPYATYLQLSGDTSYVKASFSKMQEAARSIDENRDPSNHNIMEASNTLDTAINGLGYKHSLIDDLASLHGLQSYEYIAGQLNEPTEQSWANKTKESLNTSTNAALDDWMSEKGADYYTADMVASDGYFFELGYTGNWLLTSLMMSQFPWDAELKGYDLGGTWKDYFESSVREAVLRKEELGVSPELSWGAWWDHEYGTVYNAGMSLPLLSSDLYRTRVIGNLEWLLENQSAPYQWGESFDSADYMPISTGYTVPAADYENWGHGFMIQALQEALISQKTDGTLIVGRALPTKWLSGHPDLHDEMVWSDFLINDNKRATIKLSFATPGQVVYTRIGDVPEGDVEIQIPAFTNNLKSTSAGEIVNSSSMGKVVLSATTEKATITLSSVIHEAEDAVLTGGAKTSVRYEGFSGLCYVDGFWNNPDAKAGFVVNVSRAGDYKMTLRYSAGDAEGMTIFVNGDIKATPKLTSTGDWASYADHRRTVSLSSGTNLIEFAKARMTTGVIHIDYLKIDIDGDNN